MPRDRTGPSPAAVVSPDRAGSDARPAVTAVRAVPDPAPGSFDDFFVEQLPRLNRVAVLILGSAEAAEEVVQDAFIRVLRRWDRLDNPAAYARVCVVNACRDQLRRRGRWRLREPLVAARPDHVDPSDGADDDLLAVVRRLPERQRSAIVLRYYEDLSPTEVADALGLSPSATKSLLHRALEAIRSEVIA
jgi:RNA polymerase sigma-70 factor (sigma-E family)